MLLLGVKSFLQHLLDFSNTFCQGGVMGPPPDQPLLGL